MSITEILRNYTGGGIAYESLTQRRLENDKCLELHGFKVYSQNDEDGIIEEIFRRIGVTNKIFVEFGVQNGLESNSHYLLHKGWRGLWLEGNENYVSEINAKFFPVIKTEQLKILHAFITRDNINNLIADGGFVGEIDLLSVDIDGNDYYVWENISVVKPRVVVIEYNAKFPPNHDWKMAYDEDFVWDGSDWHGASLKALENLGRKLGYQLVGTNLSGVNAFFVRAELAGDFFIYPATAEELYNPARYDKIKFSNGHPAKFCLVNQLPNIGVLNYNPAEYFRQKNIGGENRLPENVKNLAAQKFEVIASAPAKFIYHPQHTHSNFYLPYGNVDLIQQTILATDNYFEAAQLEEIFYDFKGGILSKLVAAPESVVLDIGANIGNHTLYFANELHAGKIFAFEAVENTCNILRANVQLNNLQDRVEVICRGLSSGTGRASIRNYYAGNTNIGGTDLIVGRGNIELSALDDFNIPKVTFMKIDVEGMELEVLQGAVETIRRSRPFIVVESFPDKFPLVESFMRDLDYRHKKFSGGHIFYPAEYENYHDAELENYDIVIPVVKTHAEQLRAGLPFIRENLGHDKIILLCSEETFEYFKNDGVEFMDEAEILPGMNLETIGEIIAARGGDPKRAGWYLQQFLKMYYAFVCKKDHYLIWDADTIPLKPIYFLNPRGKMFFNLKTGHHLPYFDTMQKLFRRDFQILTGATPSFISEGMIMNCETMRELVNELGGENFWRNIMNTIAAKDLSGSGFSEFETYGTWLINNHRDIVRIRPLNTQRDGMKNFRRILTGDELSELPYDTISFENWQR